MLSEKKDKMLARALRLHDKYGPFVRFYPDGNESHEETPVKDDDGALDSAIETGEKDARTPEEQAAIDKARANEQQLEQEQANTRRANEVARQTQADLETVRAETDTLREQLAAAEAKAAEAGIKNVELDEKDYEAESDRKLVQAINSLNQKLTAKDTQIAALEKKATGYEAQAREDEALAARNSRFEELLTDLDAEYGADCRNEALKRFGEQTAAGKVPKNNTAKATRVMERCYKEAKTAKDKAAAEAKKNKSSLPLDSGSGGGNAPNLAGVEIKEGSLDDVDAQVAKTELGARKS